MRFGIKILVFFLAIAAFAWSCGEGGNIIPEELTRGFWMENKTGGLLLSFEEDGSVCNYIYREHPDESTYYAYPDPEWAQYNRYLIDTDNDMLFMLPDRWYNIVRLTDSAMTLKNEEQDLNFNKLYQGEDIVVVDYDEFLDIFPGQTK